MQLITTFKKLSLFHVALVICLVVMGFGASALAQNKVKILDIIIGGDMGIGLGCKSDSDCKTDEFCHTDQKYCVICKVPPYEWTGTECECPEGTVEKDGKTCVECLQDEHCPLDYSCDTDTNNCAYCKFPMLWQNNTCVCPEGTTDQGGSCRCTQPNTELNNTTGKCDCVLDEAKCTGVNFNAKECVCCPTTKPFYNGGECRTCVQADSSKPIWDSVNKVCVECNTNADCNSAKPVCNLSSKMCEPCSSDKPVWDGSKCVQCSTNWNCPANQYCNNNTCSSCPVNQERPTNEENCRCASWAPHWDGYKCVQCLDGGYWDTNKNTCVINLHVGAFDACPWGPAPGYNVLRQRFGPYAHDYDVYISGSADDEVRLYLNSTNMPSGMHYNTWYDWINGSLIGRAGYNHAWNNHKLGRIPAGSTGGLIVVSAKGCIYFKNPGTAWLERR